MCYSPTQPGGCENKKRKFTLVEDLAIIYFIVANRCATEVKGKAMWFKLEASRVRNEDNIVLLFDT